MDKNRKTYIGEVSSNKGDKTIQVMITKYRKHSKYGKNVKYTRNFTAHDENNEANIGDIVKIMETRPLSKTKRFHLVEVIQKAVSI